MLASNVRMICVVVAEDALQLRDLRLDKLRRRMATAQATTVENTTML